MLINCCGVEEKDMVLVSYAYKNARLINALKERGSIIKRASVGRNNDLAKRIARIDKKIDDMK